MIVKVSPRTGWLWALLVALLALSTALGACSLSRSGGDLVAQECTRCHTLAPIEVAGKTEHEWRNTVYRMIAHGADLGDSEAESVIEFLAATYGP
jgi:hypothetical protein